MAPHPEERFGLHTAVRQARPDAVSDGVLVVLVGFAILAALLLAVTHFAGPAAAQTATAQTAAAAEARAAAPAAAATLATGGAWKTYTIKAGQHYANGSNFSLCLGQRTLRFRTRFSAQCAYDLGTVNQWDINKLNGLSQGQHQQDSARFGWRWLTAEKKIEVLSYCYVGGVRAPAQRICLLDPGQVAAFKLTVQDTVYVFQRLADNGKVLTEVREPRRRASLERTTYKLYPYFGGDEVAPHTMTIAIQEF